ncbi:hypothetical protein AHMF7605_07990 [Adhaeribacter arboris]|uniref:WbqC family protein n=1 Tax=Adhaeribacter arboris TaxID=2072846 RepID=A0A2T2YD71_9BACT|nr:WbqC family protein [Adhaeribacter arboris]PSR53470.1 hypothetical protein AHMF7605_07990 [Adhaeribacter arboris]
MPLLSEIHYNPCIAYFQRVNKTDEIWLEQHEHYLKQSYRNRCSILTAQGVKDLTIPVKKGNRKTLITEVEIDYDQKWLNTHWRTIKSGYGSAPYFTYYSDLLQQILEQRVPTLFGLNEALLNFYLKSLQIRKPITYTKEYITLYPNGVLDLRNQIHPKKKSAILDIKPYQQVFGKQFAPNLSIIDLLFSQGPAAKNYL